MYIIYWRAHAFRWVIWCNYKKLFLVPKKNFFPTVCTPLGFVRLFDIAGQFLIKPKFLRDINEEYFVCALEEESLRRRLKHAQSSSKTYISQIMESSSTSPDGQHELPTSLRRLRNGELQSILGTLLTEVENKRQLLDKQRQTSSLRRNILYPFAMLVLLGLTAITVLIVVQNTLGMLIGIKTLPLSTKVSYI